MIREDSSLKGVTVYQNGLGIDDKLRSKNGTTVRYFITDHLGSTVALTDANGAITSSTTYDSFGNAIPKQAAGSAASGTGSAASSTGKAASSTGSAASGTGNAASSTGNAAPKQAAGNAASGTGKAASNIPTSYRYTGREYDEDIGLYYYRNRWYDPETGRFISEDPIGFAGGDINLYGYVGNNPYGYIDPFGFWRCFPSDPPGGKPSNPALDIVQGALDVAGLAPVVGILADLTNAGISTARGNYADAALSMAAAVPVLGTAAGAGKLAKRATTIYRAVSPGELADIQKTGRLINRGSAEGKYFTDSAEHASEYAKQAVKAFGDQPYTTIKTKVPTSSLPLPTNVDRGIPAYVIPNKALKGLKPKVLNSMPIPRK